MIPRREKVMHVASRDLHVVRNEVDVGLRRIRDLPPRVNICPGHLLTSKKTTVANICPG